MNTCSARRGEGTICSPHSFGGDGIDEWSPAALLEGWVTGWMAWVSMEGPWVGASDFFG